MAKKLTPALLAHWLDQGFESEGWSAIDSYYFADAASYDPNDEDDVERARGIESVLRILTGVVKKIEKLNK